MRTRIWTELTQAKHNIEFISLYSDRQRKILRYFNICILVFSTGGVMGWKIWESIPLISCIIIALISLIRLVQPHLIMTEKQISSLDVINKFYADYYNKLEKLWYDNEHQAIDLNKAKTSFFKIKETELTIDSMVNDIIRTKPKTLIKKAKINADLYFERTFTNK